MDERDMEEEGKDREREKWGILFLEFLGIVILCLFH
jgi:hypothetical protein